MLSAHQSCSFKDNLPLGMPPRTLSRTFGSLLVPTTRSPVAARVSPASLQQPAAFRRRIASQINELPICDLHRHLDGNIRVGTILDLGLRHGLKLPGKTVEELRPFVQVTKPLASLLDFLAKFEWNTKVLVDYEDVRRVARENVEDAKNEGLAYVELRFSPSFMALGNGLHPDRVVDAVIEGVRQGERETGVRANLIGIITRQYGIASGWKELGAILERVQDKEIVGLDLAGDEAAVPCKTFAAHFDKARAAGLRITVHAGEADGPQSVRDAVEVLGAERIGHGVHSVDDPAVMDLLAEKKVGLEVCLTSNLHTSAVSSLGKHPVRQFIDRGLIWSLNTDDPGVSGIDMGHELRVAAPAAGLSPENIRQGIRNSWNMAFLSDEEKKELGVSQL